MFLPLRVIRHRPYIISAHVVRTTPSPQAFHCSNSAHAYPLPCVCVCARARPRVHVRVHVQCARMCLCLCLSVSPLSLGCCCIEKISTMCSKAPFWALIRKRDLPHQTKFPFLSPDLLLQHKLLYPCPLPPQQVPSGLH